MWLMMGLLVTTLTQPTVSRADYYTYKDESGTTCMTNDINKVPPQFRAKVTVIKEEGKKTSTPEPRTNSVLPPIQTAEQPAVKTMAPQASPSKDGWLARQLPLLKIIGIIAVILFALIAAGRLISALLPNMLGKVVRIALSLAILVWVFKSFSGRVTDAFVKMKAETATVQNAVDRDAAQKRKLSEQLER